MSAPRRPDALARVAQARADAEHSLEVLRARRERWGERLQRLPWWGVLLGGFRYIRPVRYRTSIVKSALPH